MPNGQPTLVTKVPYIACDASSVHACLSLALRLVPQAASASPAHCMQLATCTSNAACVTCRLYAGCVTCTLYAARHLQIVCSLRHRHIIWRLPKRHLICRLPQRIAATSITRREHTNGQK